jgi:hypothetical protein
MREITGDQTEDQAPQPQPPPKAQPPAAQPPSAQPPSAPPPAAQPPAAQPPDPHVFQPYSQEPTTVHFGSDGATTAPSLSAPSISRPSPEMAARWHRGRVLYGVGSAVSLLGTALSLSSIILVAVTDYPCNSIDPNANCSNGKPPPTPTDPAPLLAYMGSSVSALGFVLTAAGLGYQHALLHEMSADIGRGVFGAGTTIGVMGFASVGLSYMFGATSFLNPHDQGLAILSASMTGAGLCLISSLLYTIDSSRLKSAWNRLGTF